MATPSLNKSIYELEDFKALDEIDFTFGIDSSMEPDIKICEQLGQKILHTLVPYIPTLDLKEPKYLHTTILTNFSKGTYIIHGLLREIPRAIAGEEEGLKEMRKYIQPAIDFLQQFEQFRSGNPESFLLGRHENLIGVLQADNARLDEALTNVHTELTRQIAALSAQQIAANYVEIFNKRKSHHQNLSKIWLSASLLYSAILVRCLYLSLINNYFHVTYKDNQGVFHTNFGELSGKIVLFSLLIYVAGFLFKQYAVNKNLEVLYDHRKTALDSYQLFASSISQTDSESRNALMLQVAKSIYDFVNPGYIETKENDIARSIMEMRNVIMREKG